MANSIPILAVQLMLLSVPDVEQLNASLDPVLLENAQRIDIVSVSGKFSYAEYRSRPAALETIQFPVHTVVPSAVPFGNFTMKKERMARQSGAHSGYLLPLSRSEASLNLLGFQEVAIKGKFSGTWKVAFADDCLAAQQDNVPLGDLESSGTHRFKMADLLNCADLSRARHLVLLLVSKTGSAQVEEVSFSHPQRQPASASRGIWIWRRDLILGRENTVLQRLAAQGVKRVYLQVGDDPEVFAPFLAQAALAGVEVYALDGSPGYLTAPEELLERIRRVENYNKTNPQARYAGFQTDIEPYLNKDFAKRKSYYASAYTELLDQIKRDFTLPLSVVVPFWFDTVYAGPKSLIQRIVESADEVVLMSYRTDRRRVEEISRSTLSLGEQLGKPVWLGIELGQIADEEHHEFDRCAVASAGAVKLGSSWWCSAGNYLVPGSRISFKSKMEELPSFMQASLPFQSFHGWVLHSYEELPNR